MPVIVNEMEVVLAPEAPSGTRPEMRAAPPVDPRVWAEVQERRARAELRLLAH